MSATAATNAGPKPIENAPAAIAATLQVAQPASSQIGQGQIATIDPSTGYAALNDGATPNQVGAGFGHPPAAHCSSESSMPHDRAQGLVLSAANSVSAMNSDSRQ